jgi:hypothetical protein
MMCCCKTFNVGVDFSVGPFELNRSASTYIYVCIHERNKQSLYYIHSSRLYILLHQTFESLHGSAGPLPSPTQPQFFKYLFLEGLLGKKKKEMVIGTKGIYKIYPCIHSSISIHNICIYASYDMLICIKVIT